MTDEQMRDFAKKVIGVWPMASEWPAATWKTWQEFMDEVGPTAADLGVKQLVKERTRFAPSLPEMMDAINRADINYRYAAARLDSLRKKIAYDLEHGTYEQKERARTDGPKAEEQWLAVMRR